jgi:hypothetical protein
MKVILRNFQQIEIPLKKPFRVGDILVDRARSFSYEADFGDHIVKGEIPSLPLFYPNQSLNSLESLSFHYNEESLDYEKPLFAQSCEFENKDANIIFSIEQLILSYLRLKGKPHSWFAYPKPVAKMNSLDTGNTVNLSSSVCKLKIGRFSLEAERSMIESYLREGIRLRLDGNRMCSIKYLEQLLDGIDLSRIEYIEEPFATIKQWEEFSLKDSVGLAVDESLLDCLKSDYFPQNTVAAIIKPSLVLSISGILAAVKNSQLKNINLVISSSFETPLSFNTLIHIASNLPIHHGLGTMEHLDLPKPKQNPFKTIGDKIHGFPLLHFQL